MEKMQGILKISVVACILGISSTLGAGGPSLQAHQSVKSSYVRPQAASLETLESLGASEVEYVDGPLAPLYDFLIQRRLHRFCKLLRDAGLEDAIDSFRANGHLLHLPAGRHLDEMKRNPQLLRDFVLYHFVTGDFSSSQILNEMLVNSVQGAPLRFNVYGNVMTVSGAQILESDLEFELGKVYIIDHPLYPIPTSDIVSYLRTNNNRLYTLTGHGTHRLYF
ncbi:transforming growth factor-beta-induced protein ig-h3, partial [Caerostris extrusa]